ncbi:ABC transporter ATP-binding protein [Paracoccus methylarcula]|uniref:ABC transporter ATP-binding protein n=1 Tax=Paracoccus methylarcula TaxID=72022 RepID=UPI001FE78DB0|nr:ABC transporter ATP-binding protein [Paracoccus methylarcula]
MLEATGLEAAYGKQKVLHGLSLRIAAGRLTALVGPNGCGKSTFLRAIMGFVPLTAGQVTLDGKPLPRDRRALARRIAYLPQEAHCPDYLTLGELVELAGFARYATFAGPTERDRELFRSALRTVGLIDLAHRPVNSLSGGQRQRAWIAMVLAQDAEIILMDEPVNHLDMKYQYATLGLVQRLTREHGKTVVAVLHDLNLTAAFADEVAMLADGRLVAHGPVEHTVTESNIARVFDLGADVITHAGRRICMPHLKIPA